MHISCGDTMIRSYRVSVSPHVGDEKLDMETLNYKGKTDEVAFVPGSGFSTSLL